MRWSIITRIPRRLTNYSEFRHSSLSLLLKFSAVPFCQRLLGRINAGPHLITLLAHHCRGGEFCALSERMQVDPRYSRMSLDSIGITPCLRIDRPKLRRIRLYSSTTHSSLSLCVLAIRVLMKS
jgi:hypothetical protein